MNETTNAASILEQEYTILKAETEAIKLKMDTIKATLVEMVVEDPNTEFNQILVYKVSGRKTVGWRHIAEQFKPSREMIEENTGMSFKSSSEMAAEIFIYDELKAKYGYTSFIECFEDRMNHRAEWHDLIKNYNNPDKAKLAKEILNHNDMYVGMRSQAEIDKCIEDDICIQL